MAQHDYDIANADGATVRADLNAIFEALASMNAGSSAPSVTFQFMPWFDTATALLKIRNTANTGWVTVASLSGGNWKPYHLTTELNIVSQAVAETGTDTTPSLFTAQRVAQAIAALTPASSASPLGTLFDYLGPTAPTGWILADGGTIGNGASGASNRANADTENLFTLLWDNYADGILAVPGGRGANAAADYAANKRITVPDFRGRVAVGKDNMGGSAASRITSGGDPGIDGTVLGASGGVEELAAPLPAHTHSAPQGLEGAGSIQFTGGGFSGTSTSTGSAGSGGTHSNVQPSWIVNKIIKL